MLNGLFSSLFDSTGAAAIAPGSFLLCVAASLLIGLCLCLMAQWRSRSSESFAITLALLPASVCVVIMMVNGNLGAGVAVAGAFSLVRFRSAAGSGREISAVFIAMGAGLLAGMGFLAYAALFTLVLGGMMMVYTAFHLGSRCGAQYRQLRITIPESLNYVHVFDPVLETYTSQHTLTQVKSTNMGSMFRLTYDIVMQPGLPEKNMLDELRCLNGNLEISLCCQETENAGL